MTAVWLPDPGTLAQAAERSNDAARAYRRSDAFRTVEVAFAGCDAGDADELADRAEELLADSGLFAALIAPLAAALRGDPWFEPPFQVSRDPLRIGAVLFDSPAVAISATILSSDALAALPAPATMVVSGRLSVVRYARCGGARLRVWQTGTIDENFSLADAHACEPLAPLPLYDGMTLRFDGRCCGALLEEAQGDVVTLTAMIRAGSAPFIREFAIDGGALVRTATLDDGASRTQLLLSLLRLTERRDAGDCFDAATRDRAFFLRWAAMREWLALDLRAALPRLREMVFDHHAEIRAAARTTLAMVEARIR